MGVVRLRVIGTRLLRKIVVAITDRGPLSALDPCHPLPPCGVPAATRVLPSQHLRESIELKKRSAEYFVPFFT